MLFLSAVLLCSANANAGFTSVVGPTEAAPIEQCCDKWNGTTLKISDKYFAVIQKGLKKKTRTRVGEDEGYDSKKGAQEAADDTADKRNGK